LAQSAGATPAQLALAWLLAQGDHVVPIPGTTSRAHLRENVATASLDLPAETIARAGELVNAHSVTGARYNAQSLGEVDTEVA
jgi:aryl-alcohol dehydrogenase-like predicted oxidoreductase